MRKLLAIGGLLCLAVIGIIWGSRAFSSRPRPHILLITLDTTRWDHLSCYGYGENTTPAIDALAEEGVKYQYAVTPSSWTLPAHASLFTGVLPTHHGAHFVLSDPEIKMGLMRVNKLDSELPTLAEELKKAGYRTGGIVGGPLLHSSFGMSRGFDFYYDGNLHSFKDYEFYRSAHETTSVGVGWLTTHYSTTGDTTPFFLFLNYFDPHNPYRAPDPWGDPDVSDELCDIHSGHYDDVLNGTRELTEEELSLLVTLYDNEIRFMDKQIERLFHEMKQLGLYDNTLIVVTSDHGESFGEHRLLGHGRALYEDLIRVPLILRYPLKDGKTGVVERRVSILSIMPTLLEYIGHPIPETVASGTLKDEDQILLAELTRDVFWIESFGERFDRDEKAVYDGDYKWIWNSNGEHELYNVMVDPYETNNLSGKFADMEQSFQSRLDPLIEESRRLSSHTPPEIDPELEKRLKALGYIR